MSLKATATPPPGLAGNVNTKVTTSLQEKYPVNSILELTLSSNNEVVRGLVYCTDDISNSIVLKKSLPHTTLTSEIRLVNASSVLDKKVIMAVAPSQKNTSVSDVVEINTNEEAEEMLLPLPNISKKAVDEKERRAIKLAMESMAHVNQKATSEGQAVFDRLLKACNQVIWRGESILVLNQIRVDPPYGSNDCTLLQTGGLNEGSLERVKKIVEAGR
mmetsp:Transcript_16647/g.16072  ORF Transcript_16647/g.16072 Transcript_16647/m.16072 type:complete len:217 (-) Transcript_16647:375-1025(-)|eukprot:CAMPEP_0197831144 /NCGR_PEP_ID=MMETSP1437-20131217/7729_1 /TAXON_ID=49252 ORGANISM="Eucampia antarctica, Strain CCMP1452" /NCGR_SAMPLE_ID=MMETSP1437 /ASSEMBLY_ACC=CAM_ASM_001096 /LENGTH=216 /DNA_ID=CAMNT_0043433929 /DNA_START=167 /DNA_END=817 /DNA_ORIENTATION=-